MTNGRDLAGGNVSLDAAPIEQLPGRLRVRAGEWLQREGENPHFLCWFAVCFGIGVVLFFQSNGDARALWPLVAAAACLLAAYAGRRNIGAMRAALALFSIFAGFACGVLRMHRVETPVLHETVIGTLSGYVETIEYRINKSPQLVVKPMTLADIEPNTIPKRIRVTLRSGASPAAGEFVSAKVRLMPLPQPVRPAGYDFARDSYFKGLGAVGSVLGRMESAQAPEKSPFSLTLAAAVDRARNALTKRIHEAVGGPAGGVAAALVTGKRGYIPEETNDVLRAAGIYHIVSISGLHMVIAAGMVFWFVRAVLCLFPGAALRWPVKKIAACVAMVAATGYCVFSGADVATRRALLMTLVLLGAILAERRVLSMRNLAIAALLIMVTAPEAVLGPGFQMSFAAVAALMTLAQVSGYFTIAVRGNWASRALRHGVNWFAGAVATTFVAGLATAPFAAYHFQTAVPYGLIGNALALPLVSLVVMPMGAIGALAYPFSLDEPMWRIMGAATAVVVDVSRWVASLEGSLLHFPAFGGGAAIAAAAALIVATVMVTPLRYGAVIPLVLAVMLASTPERYAVFVDRDGRSAAVRGWDGKMFIVGAANGFLSEQWLRADGDERRWGDAGLRRDMRCDDAGCVGEGEVTVAVVKKPAAFAEDCRRADVVVSSLEAPATCAAPIVIDRWRLNDGGAAAVSVAEGGRMTVHYARSGGEAWPWQVRRTERGRKPARP